MPLGKDILLYVVVLEFFFSKAKVLRKVHLVFVKPLVFRWRTGSLATHLQLEA